MTGITHPLYTFGHGTVPHTTRIHVHIHTYMYLCILSRHTLTYTHLSVHNYPHTPYTCTHAIPHTITTTHTHHTYHTLHTPHTHHTLHTYSPHAPHTHHTHHTLHTCSPHVPHTPHHTHTTYTTHTAHILSSQSCNCGATPPRCFPQGLLPSNDNEFDLCPPRVVDLVCWQQWGIPLLLLHHHCGSLRTTPGLNPGY